MMNLKPEVVAQLERVLSSLEQLLPTAESISGFTCKGVKGRSVSFNAKPGRPIG